MSSKERTMCFYCKKSLRRDRLRSHISTVHGANFKYRESVPGGGLDRFATVTSPRPYRPTTDLREEDQPVTSSSQPQATSSTGQPDRPTPDFREKDQPGTPSQPQTTSPRAQQLTIGGESDDSSGIEETDPTDTVIRNPSNLQDTEIHPHVPSEPAPLETEDMDIQNPDEEIQKPSISPLLDSTSSFPTDPALFVNKVMTPELIRAIMEKGACQPGLHGNFNFPQNKFKRSFRPAWYYRDMKNGLKSSRDWLVYSAEKDCAYCFSCWLFADRGDNHFDPAFIDPAHGFCKWKKATEKFRAHEQSSIHLSSVRKFVATNKRLNLGMAVNQVQIRAYEQQIEHNRKVLHRLLDVALFLAKQNLAFRGHNETRFSCMSKAETSNEGNFLELVRLLSKYDGVLAKHIATSPRNTMYMSPKIQNDFIRALSEEVTRVILSEVTNAHFYGIILDSTIDISHKDQLSFCLRYVDDNFDIQERFLQFADLKASNSENLFSELKQFLEKHGLNVKWIRSQSYDGANNMSGHLTSLQARVKEENSSATYVHCCAHNLNLVLAHACDGCVEAVTFFGAVQKLYTFITGSHPRLVIFQDAQDELGMKIKTLQSLSETRWYCKYTAVKAVKDTFPALLLALERIVKREKTPENVGEAKGLLDAISKFEFLVLLEMWVDILADINSLSEYLQKKVMDVVTASVMIKSTTETVTKRRSEEHFLECLNAATSVATEEEITATFASPRIRKRKRMPGEQATDAPHQDPEDRFRRDVFYVVYDKIIYELKIRFADFHNRVRPFGCLMPSNMGKTDMFRDLTGSYSEDIDVALAEKEYEQFCLMYEELKPEKGTIENLQDMLHWVFKHDLHTAYPNLGILFRIFATIAVSSATTERSFSKLRIIKNYMRSTMGEERLSSLTLLSVERDLSEHVNFQSVIDKFSRMTSSGKRNIPL